MGKRGFSFLEILAALAILTVVSVSLLPLITNLAVTDQSLRLHARAWETAQSHLTAGYLNDLKAAADPAPFAIQWDRDVPTPNAGTARWNRLALTANPQATPVITLYLRGTVPAGN
jgi:prepilin-type N-terminal cleavage/methylation domain-containing protein